MADFNEAIRWINEGKKVRRPSWHSNNHWFKDDEGCISLGLIDRNLTPVFLVEDFKATDWEIYEDDKDWILADEFNDNPKFLKIKSEFLSEHFFKTNDVKKCRYLLS